MLQTEPYFPSRCDPATHQSVDIFTDGEPVRLNGRLLDLSDDEGLLGDEHGVVRFRRPPGAGGPSCITSGDIVSIAGHWADGILAADTVRILSPIQRGMGDPPKTEFATANARINRLKQRSAALTAARRFFTVRGFAEVETPALSSTPSQEAHLASFATVFSTAGRAPEGRYLITSPEHHMKAMLGEGFEKIYQICRCFRNGESTPVHNPEFTMIEWYRSYASYQEISCDVENLVSHVCRDVLGSTTLSYRGRSIDLEPPWCRMSIREAFERYVAIDLDRCGSVEVFAEAAQHAGCESIATDDSWEEIFFKLCIERIEPRLSELGPVLLSDYPEPLASLSKLKDPDGEVAERVEAYIGGLEVANGFTELNDPRQQRRRFMAQREKRRRMDGAAVESIDEQFLHRMACGMPPAGGIAVGLDRLVMLLTDTDRIEDVLAFPFHGSHR
jgi:lysyl-tRNA synthetase class 2